MSVLVTTNTTLSVEDDLDEAWAKVIKRLEDEAELVLPADHKTDDIAAIINPPKADPTTKTKVTEIYVKALKCIDRFGGMVAQVGSIAFGPSNQVYNAVSFLIKVSQGVQDVFNNVTLLMTRLSIFLERLGKYFDRTGPVKLDYPMRQSMYRVLEHFVSVVVLSHKLTHRWKGKDGGWKGKVEAWKGKAKVIINVGAFGDDSGIKSAIAKFEQAVADVSDVQIDEIHRGMAAALLNLGSVATTVQEIRIDTLEIRTDTQEIRTATQDIRTVALETATVVEQLRGSDEEKKTDIQIRKVLDLTEKDLLDYLAKKTHDDYASQTSGMGTWLLEDVDFQQWKAVRGSPDPVFTKIFMIQAPEGFGKSYLTHAVIEHLQKERETLKDPLTMRVAWHYFSKDSKPTTVTQALKLLIWQLAKADTAYTAFLKTATIPSNATATEIWSKLVADYSAKRRPAAMFFIILDGIDRADRKTIKSLSDIVGDISRSDEPENLRIRLLLTGNRESLQDLYKQSDRYSTRIDLEPHQLTSLSDLRQKQDIQAYVSEALSGIPLFQGVLSKEQQDLKTKILEKMPMAAPGDYNDLNRRLAEIKNSEAAGQIEELVAKVDQDSKRFITDEIHALNEQQSGPKTRQINEILIWVSAAKGESNGKLLQSMIDMVFEGRGLMNIVDTIRKDCKKLLEVSGSDDDVSFKADAEEALQQAQAVRPTANETEITMIQAMLQTSFERTFGHYEIYKKFEFPRFFDEKRKVQTDLVHLPPAENVSLRVLETCLRAICDIQDSEKYQPLRAYASDKFDDHLVDTDVKSADKAVMAQIGRRLFRMLREEAVIDTWIEKKRPECFWSMLDWFDEDNRFFDTVLAYLKDPDVEKSVQTVSTETDWLYKEDYQKIPKPKVLQHVARHVLHRWFAGDYGDSLPAILWLRTYFWRTGQYAETYSENDWWDDCSAQELEQWEEWALGTIGPVLDKGEWQLRMARACRTIADWNSTVDKDALYTRACARCAEAIAIDPLKWKAQVLHGTILSYREDYQASIAQLEQLTKTPASDGNDGFDKVYMSEVVPMLANCYLKLGNLDAAIHWYREALDHELTKDGTTGDIEQCACGIISALRKQGNLTGALEILDALNQQSAEGKTWIGALLENPEGRVHDQILALTSDTHTFDTMNGYYTAAFKDAGEDIKASGAWTHMRFLQWRLHWYCSSTTSRDSIIDEWETILDSSKNNEMMYSWSTRFCVAKELAHALFELANQFQLASSEAQACITRLEGIGKKTDDIMEYSSYHNVNQVRARLLRLSGNDDGARDVLRTAIRKAIDIIRDEDRDPRSGYESLALMLPILDDDENALAAWSLLDPDRQEDKEKGAQDVAVERDATAENDAAVEKQTLDQEDAAVEKSAAVMEDGNGTTPVPNETDPQARAATPPILEPSQDTTASGTTDLASAESTVILSGVTGFSCDGRCDKTWSYADNMYVCKECLCLQICPNCYQKLQDGKLDIGICHKSHKHLHIPPFDVEAWRVSDPKMVKVGAVWMTRYAWVRQLEVQWHLDSWALATRGIHRFKLLWLARRQRMAIAARTAAENGTQDEPEVAVNGTAVEVKGTIVVTESAVVVPEVAVAA